jgi:hypothetical protein
MVTGHGSVEDETKPEKRPGKWWKLTLVGLIGVFAVLACYELISSAGKLGPGTVTTTTPPPSAISAAAAASPHAITSAGATSVSPATTAGTPAPQAGTPAPQPLDVLSVAAFGPQGTADGDNPGAASRLINVSTFLPWSTQWYATPEFGNLRSGTGLLLTLGENATVRDIRLSLGSAPGADVQVRVGNSPSLALPVAASASGVGGSVRLAVTSRTAGRYVLIWFTRLPPDGHGHYQVSVYSVAVDG